MRRGIAVAAMVLAMSSPLSPAQSAADPALKHRDATPAPAPAPKSKPGVSTLPDDASGEYLIDGNGSTVEITIEGGRVSGYVTKLGDEGSSDKDVPVTFFFTEAAVNGHRITFTTRQVHGHWFSFEGTIERGDPQTLRAENGFYRLIGTWTTHEVAGARQYAEHVNYQSTPRSGSDADQ